MDQGTLSSTEPLPATSRVERRRRLRHKLHSPVYASFKSPQAGTVVDLSELLDLNEDGFAVHTPDPLEPGRPLALTLDLPETGTYIHGHGVAVWSDPSGRGGIRFSDLSETSRRILHEWLFANLLVAANHHAARDEQRMLQSEPLPERLPEPAEVIIEAPVVAQTEAPAQAEVVAQIEDAAEPEYAPLSAEISSAVPSAIQSLSPIDAVREQIHAAAEDPMAALDLITGCAREWTTAGGAALALRICERMICCARSGDTAPPIGAQVDVTHGLSGECVRTAQLVSSLDTANDPLVDAEACRALDIGSILAAPVVDESRVVGLLEIFSPRARAFRKEHETTLLQLADAVPRPTPEMLARLLATAETSSPPRSELAAAVHASMHSPAAPSDPESRSPRKMSRHLYLALMALAFLVAAPAAAYFGYLLAPAIQSRWFRATESSTAAAAPELVSTRTVAATPAELQRLADAGDAEAQYWIGIRYATGTNVAQDYAEAAKWFLRAADQGHVQAQARLGSYYWSGLGVPKDLNKAYFWASLAWVQGDENSKLQLEGLASQMTRSQVIAARQQADSWLHQHTQSVKTARN